MRGHPNYENQDPHALEGLDGAGHHRESLNMRRVKLNCLQSKLEMGPDQHGEARGGPENLTKIGFRNAKVGLQNHLKGRAGGETKKALSDKNNEGPGIIVKINKTTSAVPWLR